MFFLTVGALGILKNFLEHEVPLGWAKCKKAAPATHLRLPSRLLMGRKHGTKRGSKGVLGPGAKHGSRHAYTERALQLRVTFKITFLIHYEEDT